jgi:hypothetical protein
MAETDHDSGNPSAPNLDREVVVFGEDELATAKSDLINRLGGESAHKYIRFVIAALGAIPWVGSLISAAAALQGEVEQTEINELQRLWLREHEAKFREYRRAVSRTRTSRTLPRTDAIHAPHRNDPA